MTNKISYKQKVFVESYLKNKGNAKQAAIAAGYSVRTADAAASRLLRNVKVSKYLEKRQLEILSKLKLDADEILIELAKIAKGELQNISIITKSDGSKVYIQSNLVRDRLRALTILAKISGLCNRTDNEEREEIIIKIVKASELDK